MKISKVLFCFNLLLIINLSIAFLHKAFLFEARINNLLQFDQLLHQRIERKLASNEQLTQEKSSLLGDTQLNSINLFKIARDALAEAIPAYTKLINNTNYNITYSANYIKTISKISNKSIDKIEKRIGISLTKDQRHLANRLVESTLFNADMLYDDIKTKKYKKQEIFARPILDPFEGEPKELREEDLNKLGKYALDVIYSNYLNKIRGSGDIKLDTAESDKFIEDSIKRSEQLYKNRLTDAQKLEIKTFLQEALSLYMKAVGIAYIL